MIGSALVMLIECVPVGWVDWLGSRLLIDWVLGRVICLC